MKYFILLMCILAVAGCGSRKQLQVIADVRAEAQAYQQATDQVVREKIAQAMAADVLAATADIPSLPKPTVVPAEILKDPEPVVATAEKAKDNPPPYQPPGPPKRDIVAEELEKWGVIAMRIGGCLLLAGALVFVLGLIPATAPYVAPITSLVDEAVILGGFTTVSGAALAWLSQHTWIIYAVAAAGLVLLAIRYRATWWPTVRYALGLNEAKG